MEEGRNAGLWTIGVAATGNETGLGPAEFAALAASERETLVERARVRLREAGAHVVIDDLTSITGALDTLDRFTQLAG
jgi:phosphonoacetaldehyde hydrolase